jgi:hypothetical protein
MMQKALQWTQPLVTVVSLTFGIGILYGDVQEMKVAVDRGVIVDRQVQIIEVRLDEAARMRAQTLVALARVTDVVDRLNTSVTKLETRLEGR